ncbi:MAG: ABC transporter ATP-binding protein [Lawsonibacter sp.]|nr:ABC transporter ATP-binding protein [Lawsonibacter sp.]
MSLLNIQDLVIHYRTDDGIFQAVNGVNLTVEEGEALGLVGETGAGKTTTALGILRLVPAPPGKILSGKILFQGKDLLTCSKQELRKIRGEQISMIFQDPMTALNPTLPVGQQIAEVIRLHSSCSRAEAVTRAMDMLAMVGIDPGRSNEFPHQFSGGMKQRVVIAIALACSPKLLLADEPTTALDVTIQAQVLAMIRSLQKKLRTSMILITHDLGVVAETCDKVAIMYAGEIVEYGTLEQIYTSPSHPYTSGLFGAIPSLNKKVMRLSPIAGMMPDPSNLPEGCAFHPRCQYADEGCCQCHPSIVDLGGGHLARCLKAGKERT